MVLTKSVMVAMLHHTHVSNNCIVYFGLICYMSVTDGFQLTMVQLGDFSTCEVQKQYAFNRNFTFSFEFWSFPGLLSPRYGSLGWCRAGAVSRSSQAAKWSMRLNNLYACNHSGPTQPFWFSPSGEYSINYMRYAILYYKIGFVVDCFAQL